MMVAGKLDASRAVIFPGRFIACLLQTVFRAASNGRIILNNQNMLCHSGEYSNRTQDCQWSEKTTKVSKTFVVW